MFPRSVGAKSYELTDHLGNVKAVVSDRKKLSDEVREYRYVYGFENSNDVPSEAWSGWSFSTEHVYRGSQSVKVTGFGHLFRMAVEPGDTVSAEAMMKFVSGTTGSHIYLAFQDENGQNEVGVGSEQRDLPSHQHVNEWSRIVHPPTVVPAGKYSVLVYLRKRSEHSEAWFDDFKISVKRGYAEPVLSAEVLSANSYYAFGSLMPKRSFNSSGYRYGFNGQEKVDEIHPSHYTAEYWEYDSRTGRRWNLDPVVKPWISSYACLSNNPIIRIDPKGNDDYIADENGKLVSINKTDQEHKLFTQTTVDNKTVNTEILFNDPEEDRKQLAQYEVGDQVFKTYSKDDIENMVNETQVPTMSKKSYSDRVNFIMEESVGGNSLDFSGKPDSKLSSSFNIIDGIAYNMKDAGNFVWGYSASKLGFSSGEVKAGSEYYAWKDGKSSNILDISQNYSDNSFIRWFQEKTWTGDSKGDQRAIFRGYYMERGRTGLFDFFDPDGKPSGMIRLDGLAR